MDAIRELAAPGALMVLSEQGIARASLDEALRMQWDAGHPIRVAADRLARDLEAMGRVTRVVSQPLQAAEPRRSGGVGWMTRWRVSSSRW
jgi:hypothetical protein